EDDFAADPAELFFDLTYVFAFSQLVSYLIHHPDWRGVGEFILLFMMLWLPWSQFTWSANAVAGNSRPVRVLFMIATIVSIPMAASVTSAFEDGGPVFALSASMILAIGMFTMFAGLRDNPEIRAAIVRYSIPNSIAIALMITGAFFDGDIRIWLWIAAVSTFVVGTLLAGSSEWLIRPGHFAERHGLLTIVALGEIVVATGLPVVDSLEEGAGLPTRTIIALIAAGLFAVLLWWGYFDRPHPALEQRHHQIEDGFESGSFARHVYTYIHFPLIAGIILTAAALEEITLHPNEPLASPFRWMLLAGLTSYLVAIAAAIVRAFGRIAIERLIATVLLAVLIVATAGTDGIVLLIAIDIVLLLTLAIEHQRVEVQHRLVVTISNEPGPPAEETQQ
ncbi:MAG: low temperature requirement protein A, partial [Acidobacteria bacterium]|nr:low temperature requirement protein A [Acidobacteriota bacterium]